MINEERATSNKRQAMSHDRRPSPDPLSGRRLVMRFYWSVFIDALVLDRRFWMAESTAAHDAI
jgi:hypothetical protein